MALSVTLAWLFRASLLAVPPLVFLYWRISRRKFIQLVNQIPGPKTMAVLGNASQMIRNMSPVEVFNLTVQQLALFGSLIRLWVVNQVQVVILSARNAEPILQSMTYHTKSAQYRFLHDWMGLGLLTAKDEKWRIHRKILTPAFHFNILYEFLPIFNKHALILTQRLSADKSIADQKGINIFDFSSPCSLDIICESSMGKDLRAQDGGNKDYVQAILRVNDCLVRRYFSVLLRPDFIFKFSPTKRTLDRNLKILSDFTDKVIDERREYHRHRRAQNVQANGVAGGRRRLAFLDLLLEAEADGSEFMTQQDIRDEVATFMFEGHDTVSTAMCWALFMIGTHPKVQARVVEELESVFGSSGRAPEMADLAELKYLERCIKESLRLYPSVAFFERSLREDAVLEKHTVPAGCTVTFHNYLLHRDPEYWPNPEKFDPDRFLPENSKGRHPYCYLPFSAGPRNCIGQKFAIMEEKVVLSTVLRRFRVEAAHSPEKAELQVAIVLRPRNGLRIRLYERESHPNLRVTEEFL